MTDDRDDDIEQSIAYKMQIDDLEEKLKIALDAAILGLSFAPTGEVVPGLCPSFYHTLDYKSEVELQQKINKARQSIANMMVER